MKQMYVTMITKLWTTDQSNQKVQHEQIIKLKQIQTCENTLKIIKILKQSDLIK